MRQLNWNERAAVETVPGKMACQAVAGGSRGRELLTGQGAKVAFGIDWDRLSNGDPLDAAE